MKIKILFSVLAIVCFFSCTSEPKHTDGPDMSKVDTTKKLPVENPYKNSKLEARVFNNDTVKVRKPKDGDEIAPVIHGFGYQIYIDDNLYINQAHLPGLPGLKAFNTSEQAQKAGDFVCYKIRNNIMPPTVTKAELDSLGVLK